MKSPNRLSIAGVLSAIAASLCCITPVLALFAGASGIASAFSWLEPLRPFLILVTVVVLGFAWYSTLRSRRQATCECETKPKSNFLQSKLWLGIITVFSVAMLAFPYYSPAFYPSSVQNENPTSDALVTTKFTIEGMTCDACEMHVRHEVEKLEGVAETRVSYNAASAIITYDTLRMNIATLQKTINATGYTVTKVGEE